MDNAKPTFNLGQLHCLLFCVDVKHISEKKMAHKCSPGICPTFPTCPVFKTIDLFSFLISRTLTNFLSQYLPARRVQGRHDQKVHLLIKFFLQKIISLILEVIQLYKDTAFFFSRNEDSLVGLVYTERGNKIS